MAGSPSRREFLRWAAALGLVPAIAACGRDAPTPPPVATDADTGREPTRSSLGPELLVSGLVALSEAHRSRWNQGHHGAAVIAACYFCEENTLDERTTTALRKQVEAFIAHRRAAFADVDPGRGHADPEAIVDQLSKHIGELRSGGHDAIYATLALRVLTDHPELATPKVVEGTCALLRKFVETLPEQHAAAPGTRTPTYDGPRNAARRTLHALRRPWSHIEQVGAGNVVHWITHADALTTLAALGYDDVAAIGYGAHARYVDQPTTPGDAAEPDTPGVDWLAPDYWESDAPKRPQKGSWFFGHAFKLPYSLFRLLRGADEPEHREACLLRASRLSVPFP